MKKVYRTKEDATMALAHAGYILNKEVSGSGLTYAIWNQENTTDKAIVFFRKSGTVEIVDYYFIEENFRILGLLRTGKT